MINVTSEEILTMSHKELVEFCEQNPEVLDEEGHALLEISKSYDD